MPTNKPMKMQWLTVDGRQVPSILPNHWNEQKNDWDITGTKNPLPIANYTQNASGVWLPTSESNPMPTQLTGSIVEKITSFIDVTVTAGSTLVLNNNVGGLTRYRSLRAVGRCASGEPTLPSWRVDGYWKEYGPDYSISRYISEAEVFFDEVGQRLAGEIDVYYSTLEFRVRNNSDIEEKYDIYLMGVK